MSDFGFLLGCLLIAVTLLAVAQELRGIQRALRKTEEQEDDPKTT